MAAPHRTALLLAAAASALVSGGARAQTLFGGAWPEIGGWGQAWNEDARGPAPAPPPPAAAPVPRTETPAPGPVVSGPAPVIPPAVRAARGPIAPTLDGDANSEAGEQPIRLTADQIIHDRELGIVSAVGRVEVVQKDRSLVADTVSYNLKQDIIAASGNVTLMEPTGEVMFSDYFELTGDFKNGVAQEIRVLLADRSRMAAASAHRVGGERTDFDKAVYTACEPCREDPGRTPVWQAKAERVTHNATDKTIEYKDAWIELGGVPVMYTPYLSHPDPSVKRQSGFIVPTAGMNSQLGTSATIPYFWALRDNEDVTFSPRLLFPKSTTTKKPNVEDAGEGLLQQVVLAAQHRWAGATGETRSSASLTADRYTGDLRGHIDARGKFDLNRVWRAGYQVERTSDDTYAPLYGFRFDNNRPWLTTRPYLEGFGRRSYALAEGFSFQGNREADDPGRSPLVLPHAAYTHVGEPGWRGSYTTFNADTLSYMRDEGSNASRLSLQGGWHLPWTTANGEIYRLSTSLRTDGYRASELSDGGDASTARAIPQISLNWRYPFVSSRGIPQVLEPMAMVAASPNGNNPATIPNEDSIDFELDETNVLRPDRLVGLDRVEGGLRGGYGLRWTGYPYRGGYVLAQAAQGWRAHPDSTFARNSGFTDTLSDYVGRLDIAPVSNLVLINRARLDRDTLEIRRTENSVTIGPPAFRVDTNYIRLESLTGDDGVVVPRRQYITYGLSSALTRYWFLRTLASHDLTDSGGPLAWSAQVAYNDECFAFITNFRRYYTHAADLESGFDLTFNLVFKTLGDVPLNVF